MHDAAWAEDKGIPAVSVATTAFEPLVRVKRIQLGRPDLPVVYVEHPFSSRTDEDVRRIAEESVDEVVRALVRRSEP